MMMSHITDFISYQEIMKIIEQDGELKTDGEVLDELMLYMKEAGERYEKAFWGDDEENSNEQDN